MNLVNVDGLIARRNIQRLKVEKAALDTGYLNTLSDDAIPVLVSELDNPYLSGVEKDEIGAVLACRAFTLEKDPKWQSFTLSVYRAWKALEENPELWEDLEVVEDEYWNIYVEVGEEKFYCDNQGWMD